MKPNSTYYLNSSHLLKKFLILSRKKPWANLETKTKSLKRYTKKKFLHFPKTKYPENFLYSLINES